MKSFNLAERPEELEAGMQSLQMSSEPVTRRIAAPEVAEKTAANPTLEQPARPRALRRGLRARTIETRDQGLRPFRVF
ncbi:MAG TPA: hypothetical protein VM146_02045 [Steroidobacteraceae bacterium]|nr:hypothetical protein [Steroidobacteraceae bacterium]